MRGGYCGDAGGRGLVALIRIFRFGRPLLGFSIMRKGEVQSAEPQITKLLRELVDIPAHQIQRLRAFGDQSQGQSAITAGNGHGDTPQFFRGKRHLDRAAGKISKAGRKLTAKVD